MALLLPKKKKKKKEPRQVEIKKINLPHQIKKKNSKHLYNDMYKTHFEENFPIN